MSKTNPISHHDTYPLRQGMNKVSGLVLQMLHFELWMGFLVPNSTHKTGPKTKHLLLHESRTKTTQQTNENEAKIDSLQKKRNGRSWFVLKCGVIFSLIKKKNTN
jgi:hypothetical protein